MITKNTTARKNRYICFKLNGVDIPTTGSIRDHLKACKERLKLIRKSLPKAS